MSTKQIHRTVSKSKVKSNEGTNISNKAQKSKLQKKVGKKTTKSLIKAKSHKNGSYSKSKSKPRTPNPTKNIKINPKKSKKKISEYQFTSCDTLYAQIMRAYHAYYSLMNYYGNLLFQYLYQKPIFS